VGNTFKLDDLLGEEPQEGRPKKPRGREAYAIDDLLDPAAARPACGPDRASAHERRHRPAG
jgi:hypothetical protein